MNRWGISAEITETIEERQMVIKIKHKNFKRQFQSWRISLARLSVNLKQVNRNYPNLNKKGKKRV